LEWLAGASNIDQNLAWGIAIGTIYNKERGHFWSSIEAL
jgi:hypothetical protein